MVDDDVCYVFVDWMVDFENLFFVKVLVNCYWKYFFGCGLVDLEDDMWVINLVCNFELFDVFVSEFIVSEFDLKVLIKNICMLLIY